jgi:hypothetical protein
MKVLSMLSIIQTRTEYVASQSSADEADPSLRPLTARVGRVRNDGRDFEDITYWALTLPGRTNRVEN